jgi:hypothetical protein
MLIAHHSADVAPSTMVETRPSGQKYLRAVQRNLCKNSVLNCNKLHLSENLRVSHFASHTIDSDNNFIPIDIQF